MDKTKLEFSEGMFSNREEQEIEEKLEELSFISVRRAHEGNYIVIEKR